MWTGMPEQCAETGWVGSWEGWPAVYSGGYILWCSQRGGSVLGGIGGFEEGDFGGGYEGSLHLQTTELADDPAIRELEG